MIRVGVGEVVDRVSFWRYVEIPNSADNDSNVLLYDWDVRSEMLLPITDTDKCHSYSGALKSFHLDSFLLYYPTHLQAHWNTLTNFITKQVKTS